MPINVIAAALYAGVAGILWLAQGWLIFEPERTLPVRANELAFKVDEVRIPVAGRETLAAWWIPPGAADGKLFLYFHGNHGNIGSSVGQTELLRGLGHGVLMPDYRGFGESDGQFPSEATMYEDAEAALAFAERTLGYGPRDIFVYGHSLGAAVAVDLAAKHPELGGLVAESAFTSIAAMAHVDRPYMIFPVGLLLTERFQSDAKVARLRMPVLYIHGTDDEVVPFRMGQALYARSGGRKQFLAIAGGRHADNRRVAPQAMRNALEQLVRSGAEIAAH